MTPLSDAEAFLAANARAELTVFDKSGLLPHDEQAQAFNRLVVGLLSGSEARSSQPVPQTPGTDPNTPYGVE